MRVWHHPIVEELGEHREPAHVVERRDRSRQESNRSDSEEHPFNGHTLVKLRLRGHRLVRVESRAAQRSEVQDRQRYVLFQVPRKREIHGFLSLPRRRSSALGGFRLDQAHPPRDRIVDRYAVTLCEAIEVEVTVGLRKLREESDHRLRPLCLLRARRRARARSRWLRPRRLVQGA